MSIDEVQPPEPIRTWLDGKRTYLVAGAILLCGILSSCGVEIPEFVWAALAALGLGFVRAGIKKGAVAS
jgi:hypothetical protein